MNGRCETCDAEKVCAYPYKPTECANKRKFEMHPDAVDCPACNGSGYTYLWQCKQCKGIGIVVPNGAGKGLATTPMSRRPASADF